MPPLSGVMLDAVDLWATMGYAIDWRVLPTLCDVYGVALSDELVARLILAQKNLGA